MNAAPAEPKKRCHLAWHITSRCNLACKHCLRRNSYQPTTDLPPDQCVLILDSFIQFAKDTNRDAEVEFSGGNPLLREDFYDLLRKTHEFKKAGIVKNIRILGNPETLNDQTVGALKAAEIDDIFLSIDGLEEVNDSIRGKGAFQAVLRGIRALVAAGIEPSIKFTLTRANAHQVVDVIKLVLAEKVHHFGMGPLILAGGGYEMRDQALSPAEYRAVLLEILKFLDAEGDQYPEFRRSFMGFNRMYELLFYELGRSEEYRSLSQKRSGPRRLHGNGNVLFVVWSDGEVVLRREMLRQGRVPRDSFQKIYDNSYLLHILEDSAYMNKAAREAQLRYVKCRACPIADTCLPGMVGTFGMKVLFQPSEHCWRC